MISTSQVMAILRFELLFYLVTSSMTSWVCETSVWNKKLFVWHHPFVSKSSWQTSWQTHQQTLRFCARDGGYKANYLSSVIFWFIFQHCQNTSQIWNIMFICGKCPQSSAAVTSVKYEFKEFKESDRHFCKIEDFTYREICEQSFGNTHPRLCAIAMQSLFE